MPDLSTHLKGAAKQAASAVKGRTGIYSTLAKEHGEVSSLLKKALAAKSVERRAELLNEIRIEVLSHAYAEQETLYDALDRFEETQRKAGYSRGEHQEIESALRKALAAPAGTPEQVSAIEDLQGTIEHHVDEEENDLFVRAEKLLSKEEEKVLLERFAELSRVKKLQLERDDVGLAQEPLAGNQR